LLDRPATSLGATWPVVGKYICGNIPPPMKQGVTRKQEANQQNRTAPACSLTLLTEQKKP
jgi:hypothetical protein